MFHNDVRGLYGRLLGAFSHILFYNITLSGMIIASFTADSNGKRVLKLIRPS